MCLARAISPQSLSLDPTPPSDTQLTTLRHTTYYLHNPRLGTPTIESTECFKSWQKNEMTQYNIIQSDMSENDDENDPNPPKIPSLWDSS